MKGPKMMRNFLSGTFLDEDKVSIYLKPGGVMLSTHLAPDISVAELRRLFRMLLTDPHARSSELQGKLFPA